MRQRCRRSAGAVGLATRRHRPEGLDLSVPDPDIPIVQIRRRVAVARHQPQLVAHLQHAAGVKHHAVLVRATDVFDVVAAEHERQAAVDRLDLQAGIDDRPIGLRMAHHLREQEEGIFPFTRVESRTIGIPDASVVGVHERVGPTLELVVNARIALELIGAGAATAHQHGLQPGHLKAGDDVFHLSDRDVEFLRARGMSLQMLG